MVYPSLLVWFLRKKQKKGRIFCLVSDGECQEGTTWESLLIATKHKLDNLIVIIDYNKIQALSKLEDALPLKNLKANKIFQLRLYQYTKRTFI